MTAQRLACAWGALLALTVLGAALPFSGSPPRLAGVAILAVAGMKARLVLLDYLELRGVIGWAAALQSILAAFIVGLAALALAA